MSLHRPTNRNFWRRFVGPYIDLISHKGQWIFAESNLLIRLTGNYIHWLYVEFKFNIYLIDLFMYPMDHVKIS